MILEDQGNIGQGGEAPDVMSPEDFLNGGQVEPTPDDQSSQEPAPEAPEDAPDDSTPSEMEQLMARLEESDRNFKELQAEFTRRNQQGWQPQQLQQPPHQPPSQANVLGLDVSRMSPEDQQAIGFLGQLVTNAIDSRFGPVEQKFNQFEQDNVLDREASAMKAKYPDFDREAATKVILNKSVSDFELAYAYLNGKKGASTAAAKAKEDLLRKFKANTASGKGKEPSTGKLRPYEPKTDANRPIDELYREGMNELGT